jgi:DNA-binding HxlR family transcriptional regulator
MPTVRITKSSLLDCPVMDGTAKAEFRNAAKAANVFSDATVTWLAKKDTQQQSNWLRTSIDLSRQIFQPWTIEILFMLTVLGPARFGELEERLSVSSRTLSDRLRSLKEAGLVDRIVHDEHPVRIEYLPTVKGRKTAALAAPLICHLTLEIMKENR